MTKLTKSPIVSIFERSERSDPPREDQQPTMRSYQSDTLFTKGLAQQDRRHRRPLKSYESHTLFCRCDVSCAIL